MSEHFRTGANCSIFPPMVFRKLKLNVRYYLKLFETVCSAYKTNKICSFTLDVIIEHVLILISVSHNPIGWEFKIQVQYQMIPCPC